MRDRVVAKAIATLIELDLRRFNHDSSFGYRAGLSWNDAIAAIHKAAGSGLTWVLEADITNFFGEVNNDLLFGKLFRVIGKPSIKELLTAAVVNESGTATRSNRNTRVAFPKQEREYRKGQSFRQCWRTFT